MASERGSVGTTFAHANPENRCVFLCLLGSFGRNEHNAPHRMDNPLDAGDAIVTLVYIAKTTSFRHQRHVYSSAAPAKELARTTPPATNMAKCNSGTLTETAAPVALA